MLFVFFPKFSIKLPAFADITTSCWHPLIASWLLYFFFQQCLGHNLPRCLIQLNLFLLQGVVFGSNFKTCSNPKRNLSCLFSLVFPSKLLHCVQFRLLLSWATSLLLIAYHQNPHCFWGQPWAWTSPHATLNKAFLGSTLKFSVLTACFSL